MHTYIGVLDKSKKLIEVIPSSSLKSLVDDGTISGMVYVDVYVYTISSMVYVYTTTSIYYCSTMT